MVSRPLPIASALLCLLFAFGLGCSHGDSDAPVTPTAALPVLGAPFAEAVSADGMASGVLGIYWLERDAENPTQAQLQLSRTGEAQGDLYALSIRPFLTASSLTVQSSVAGPNNTTDYTLRFVHPYTIPANFTPPATATKRMDLFIFDVNLLLAVTGTDTFFSNALKTNWNAMPSPSGFRQAGPLFDPATVGVSNGTNVFPYQLVGNISSTSPAGNYDAAGGWSGNEWFAPTGYDTVPQGATIDTVMRISNTIPTPLPLVVLAKYMDPRKGTTAVEKRANRLPSSTDPTKCRYFLPEACGDLQRIGTIQAGTLTHTTSTEVVNVSATLLDWDNAATKASTFPNQSNLNQIAELSKPVNCDASFPQLKAGGVFPGTVGTTPSGALNELIGVTFAITNVDKTVVPPDASGIDVPGLLRFRDQQDTTSPAQILLNESLVPQTPPAGYEASTRYQKLAVHVALGLAAPDLTAVNPSAGTTGAPLSPVATNTGGAATTWSWNFGGGATPNTSASATPAITLNAPGNYSATVTAVNATGSDLFPFTLMVTPGVVPVITAVNPTSGFAMRSQSFGITTSGGTPTSWSWNFGGGANPNVSSAAAPVVTLGIAGSYSGTVTASNIYGSSAPYPFTLVANNKLLALRFVIVTNGAQLPAIVQGLPAWTAANAWNWVNTNINPVYVNSGVQFDQAQFLYEPLNYPTVFNVDTGTEHNWLMAVIFDQPGDALNFYVVNSAPWYPGMGGIAGDKNCSPDNYGRGCYIVPQNTPDDQKDAAHELGHVMNLPHIRTGTPLTALNNNLMSYWTYDLSLSTSISADDPFTFCWLWAAEPMNQRGVVNDWCWQNLP
ncbi:MAG: PKD domain-containing protein [bacterium]